jgi:hypothetical protein
LILGDPWFTELTGERPRRGVFTSVADLTAAMTTWADRCNDDEDAALVASTGALDAQGHSRAV